MRFLRNTNLLLPTRFSKPFSERKQNKSLRGNGDVAFSEKISTISNLSGKTTCPTHVYAFLRGLVSSKEAQNLKSNNHNQYNHLTLPPVLPDRVSKTSEEKHYRLSLEKNKKEQTNLHSGKTEQGVEAGRIQDQDIFSRKSYSNIVRQKKVLRLQKLY